MLILIAKMDSLWSNYPGAVPWWRLATLDHCLIGKPDTFLGFLGGVHGQEADQG